MGVSCVRAGFKAMRRREFITLLGGGLAAWPLAAPAPAQAVPVIGFLSSASRDQQTQQLVAFQQGLGEAGYVDGRTVAIEYRSAEGQYDRLPALAADLVRRKVALIVATGGTISVQAARAETETIPILFMSGFDPVQLGTVAGIRRGVGNVAGISLHSIPLAAKRLEFLRELVPGAANIAMLSNPNGFFTEIERKDIEAATREAGLQLLVLRAGADSDLLPAFTAAAQHGVDTLLVSADAFLTSRRAQIVALAAQHAMRAAYPWREYVEAGGLMSYGPRLSDAYRELGRYAGRILRGAAPADLPIHVPRKFELVINLRTAKTLGITVPPLLLARADDVIE
jgi:putative tryptophan/tyrosine transport system substrate-binding protein